MAAPEGGATLFPALLAASIALVALAVPCHRLPPRLTYPRPQPPETVAT